MARSPQPGSRPRRAPRQHLAKHGCGELVRRTRGRALEQIAHGLRFCRELAVDERAQARGHKNQLDAQAAAPSKRVKIMRPAAVCNTLVTVTETVRPIWPLPPSTTIVVQTPVQLGQLQNNRYPLLSGLKGGDMVVVSNTALLRTGLPVKVASGAEGTDLN